MIGRRASAPIPPERQASVYQRAISTGRVSRPGELHPEPLPEPYVSVSAHTAPTIAPFRTICQCANNAGARRDIRATHWYARR